MHVLADPRHHAEQMAWVRGVRRSLTPSLKARLRRFAFLLAPLPELFVDLLPSPRATTFDQELILLGKSRAQFRAALVRRMLDKRLLSNTDLIHAAQPAALKCLATESSQRWPGAAPLFGDLVADSKGLLRDFCETVAAFFECGFAAQWEGFESQAWDDAALRKRLLRRFGVAAMLRTLTRELTVEGDRRRASISYGGKESAGMRLELPADAMIALTPSYFTWPHATFVVLKRATLDVRITYPLASPATAYASGQRWSEAAKGFTALTDPIRLQMLDLLRRRDLSTREFAGLLRLSEGAVSRHLSLLRRAGLVTSVRDGYFVLYRRAPDGLSKLVASVAVLGEE